MVIEEEKKHPNLVLKYGFNHRYHESVKDALDVITNKSLGEVINVRGVYGKSRVVPFNGGWRAERKYAGGGILLDQGIHMLDLIRMFCGEFEETRTTRHSRGRACRIECATKRPVGTSISHGSSGGGCYGWGMDFLQSCFESSGDGQFYNAVGAATQRG